MTLVWSIKDKVELQYMTRPFIGCPSFYGQLKPLSMMIMIILKALTNCHGMRMNGDGVILVKFGSNNDKLKFNSFNNPSLLFKVYNQEKIREFGPNNIMVTEWDFTKNIKQQRNNIISNRDPSLATLKEIDMINSSQETIIKIGVTVMAKGRNKEKEREL